MTPFYLRQYPSHVMRCIFNILPSDSKGKGMERYEEKWRKCKSIGFLPIYQEKDRKLFHLQLSFETFACLPQPLWLQMWLSPMATSALRTKVMSQFRDCEIRTKMTVWCAEHFHCVTLCLPFSALQSTDSVTSVTTHSEFLKFVEVQYLKGYSGLSLSYCQTHRSTMSGTLVSSGPVCHS